LRSTRPLVLIFHFSMGALTGLRLFSIFVSDSDWDAGQSRVVWLKQLHALQLTPRDAGVQVGDCGLGSFSCAPGMS
jgi:hypothetical protein